MIMRAYFLLIVALIGSGSALFGVISPASLADGTEGIGFPAITFTSDQVNPRDPSIRWVATNRPPGINIDDRGRYGGKPTRPGNYSVTISVYTKLRSRSILRDSFSINHTINSSPTPTINPSILPIAKYDARYHPTAGFKLTASGGTPFPSNSRFPSGYSWEVVRGASEFQNLPVNMNLSPGGIISGVPTSRAPFPSSVQTYVFKVRVTDLAGKFALHDYTLIVYPADPPVILTECPLPEGLEQNLYRNFRLSGAKGKPNYTWSVTPRENFPSGLKFDSRTGIISGRPNTSGNFSFDIVLRDANGLKNSKSCSITIHPVPHITTTAILDCAMVGKQVCSTIEAIGGNTPYHWEVLSPASAITISPSGQSTALICGNFTASGNQSVTIKVTDNKTSKFTTKTFTVMVYPPFQITTINPLINGKVNESYTDFFKATGGKPPYTWQILPQIYVADFNNNKIKKFYEGGIVKTYAGNGIKASLDGNLTTSSFNQPYGMAFDPNGNLYVADRTKIRKVSLSGNVTTLAGDFSSPEDMVADDNGNVYVADAGTHFIKKISSSGQVGILAGGQGYADGIGTAAKFYGLQGICWDLDGDMLVTDMSNHAIRKIGIDGTVTTVAGAPPPTASSGYADGDIAFAKFNGPHDVKVGNDGTIYVLDHSNGCIRKISVNGIVSTMGSKGNLIKPYCLSVDNGGFVYVSDGESNHDIRKISPSGNVTPFSGGGAGDIVNVPPEQARFKSPRGIEINPYEDLPLGLTLNATTGEISGNPEKHGLYNLTYRVTDSCGNTAIGSCTLTIDKSKPEFDFELPWKFTDEGSIADGHNGSLRNYTSTTLPTGALWSVESDNLTLKVSWENSSGCPGGSNPNTQSATASINMSTSKPQKISLEWVGIGELEAPNFEKMEVYINGNFIGSAQAAGGNQDCAMGPVTSVNNYPSGYSLPAGNHVISINATTNDGAYHIGAYYQFSFTLLE
jgi:hypothetical protein